MGRGVGVRGTGRVRGVWIRIGRPREVDQASVDVSGGRRGPFAEPVLADDIVENGGQRGGVGVGVGVGGHWVWRMPSASGIHESGIHRHSRAFANQAGERLGLTGGVGSRWLHVRLSSSLTTAEDGRLCTRHLYTRPHHHHLDTSPHSAALRRS